MEMLKLELKLQPGTAEAIRLVANALGTTIEEMLIHHLETMRDAVNYTSARSCCEENFGTTSPTALSDGINSIQ